MPDAGATGRSAPGRQVAVARLLVIEDDLDMQLLIRHSAPAGWHVSVSGTGAAGIDAALATDPDVIVLDLGLPDMSGESVLAALKADPALAWRPVVVLSAVLDHERAIEVLDSGAQDALPKPTSPSMLEARLRAAHRVAEGYRAAQAEQDALATAEEQLRLTFDRAPIGMALIDTTGHVVRANAVLVDLFGYDLDELMRLSVSELTHPDDVEGDRILARRLLTGEIDRYNREMRCVRRDGTIVWTDIHVSLVRRDDGRPRHFVAHVLDLTESRDAAASVVAAELAEAQARLRYRTAVDAAPLGVAETDEYGRLVTVNRALADMLGQSPDSLVGRYTFDNAHPVDREASADVFRRLRNGQVRSWSSQRRFRHADGHWLTLQTHGSALLDASGRARGALLYVADATETVVRLDQLATQAETDALTGLLNRTGFAKFAERLGATPVQVSVLFVDLDRFKPVNDRLGHEAGDEVLRATADRIRHLLRAHDAVARVGGDEFVIVLSDDQPGAGEALAHRVETALSAPIELEEATVGIGASVGVSRGRAADLHRLVALADEAMYHRKEDRRTVRANGDPDSNLG